VMKRRCAIYMRYSSQLRRDASIEDQERRCRERAEREGWPVVEEYVVADRAISVASVAGRDGLLRLIEVAKRKDRPFDCVLFYDTERFARDLPDLLRSIDTLRFYGVDVVSVADGIDSAQPLGRQMFVLQGMHAEQFLVALRDKVHRGQEGRVLKGFNPGGKCYGYRNVPIEDSSRTMKYGRPAVLGVRLEIIEEHAKVIRRMFWMSADNMGYAAIAKVFNGEGIPGPTGGHWSRYTIQAMLHNERYHGIHVWGRTKKDKNPETGKKVTRDAPPSGQRRVEVPLWRIVPEELWRAVQERREQLNASGVHRLGGMQRTERSRRYLFSGSLTCGQCGASMVICAGGGKRGYVKYGCHAHKQSGMCGNKLMIRQDRLERQLLAAIEQRLLNPATLEFAVKRCEEGLRSRLAEMERKGSITTLDSLRKRRQDLTSRRARLIEAIEIVGGDLISLTKRLREVEHEITRLNEAIAVHRPVRPDTAVDGIREQVVKSIRQLGEMLKVEDVSRAKEAIAKHIGKLVLTPVEHDGRPVYKVSGGVSLQPPSADTGKCRMQLVARDGIEPPTPAFSGLRSTD
jgi:site-specific DNA recombinase